MKTTKAKTEIQVVVRGLAEHQSEHDRRTRDINLAMKRLGGVDDRCRWLLEDFVARDPDALSTGERVIARDNLQALAFGMPSVPIQATDRRAGWAGDDPVLTDDRAFRALWQRIAELAAAHRTPVPWATEGVFTRQHTPGPYIHFRVEAHGRGLASAVQAAVIDLLSAGTRIRECPECHRLFVARRRQERHAKCARQRRDRNRPSRNKKGLKPASKREDEPHRKVIRRTEARQRASTRKGR
jgi:hypothetical protein